MADIHDVRWLRALQVDLDNLQDPDVTYNKTATPITIDFTYVFDTPDEPSGHKPYPIREKLDFNGRKITVSAIRNRMANRRRYRRPKTQLQKHELAVIYADRKPIEEWDAEELARGRPRNKDGSFKGRKPEFVTMAVHEEAVEKFSKVIKTEMNVATISAIEEINKILANDETDYRGKPLVSSSTKLDAAKFLIEHLLGKPKQHIESDVSVKLQGILGTVIVNPEDNTSEREVLQGYSTAHYPGVTMELASMEDANDIGKE